MSRNDLDLYTAIFMAGAMFLCIGRAEWVAVGPCFVATLAQLRLIALDKT